MTKPLVAKKQPQSEDTQERTKSIQSGVQPASASASASKPPRHNKRRNSAMISTVGAAAAAAAIAKPVMTNGLSTNVVEAVKVHQSTFESAPTSESQAWHHSHLGQCAHPNSTKRSKPNGITPHATPVNSIIDEARQHDMSEASVLSLLCPAEGSATPGAKDFHATLTRYIHQLRRDQNERSMQAQERRKALHAKALTAIAQQKNHRKRMRNSEFTRAATEGSQQSLANIQPALAPVSDLDLSPRLCEAIIDRLVAQIRNSIPIHSACVASSESTDYNSVYWPSLELIFQTDLVSSSYAHPLLFQTMIECKHLSLLRCAISHIHNTSEEQMVDTLECVLDQKIALRTHKQTIKSTNETTQSDSESALPAMVEHQFKGAKPFDTVLAQLQSTGCAVNSAQSSAEEERTNNVNSLLDVLLSAPFESQRMLSCLQSATALLQRSDLLEELLQHLHIWLCRHWYSHSKPHKMLNKHKQQHADKQHADQQATSEAAEEEFKVELEPTSQVTDTAKPSLASPRVEAAREQKHSPAAALESNWTRVQSTHRIPSLSQTLTWLLLVCDAYFVYFLVLPSGLVRRLIKDIADILTDSHLPLVEGSAELKGILKQIAAMQKNKHLTTQQHQARQSAAGSQDELQSMQTQSAGLPEYSLEVLAI